MTSKDTLAFLGALSSKICHDIVAPVSAIDMGISLLDEHIPDSIKNDPAYKLLQDSVTRTLQKINFFRYALALGKSDPSPSRKEFIDHCSNACSHFKINFILNEFTHTESSSNLCLRISACILYLLTETLPKGGTINLSISDQSIVFDALGPMAIRSPSLDKIAGHNTLEKHKAHDVIPEIIQLGLDILELTMHTKHSTTASKISLCRATNKS